MHRQIVYPSAIPQDTDILYVGKHAMIGLGMLMQAILGTGTLCSGLACNATAPASMQVGVAPGSIMSLENVDNTAFGSLAADTTDQIVKQGIVLGTTLLSCPAPTTAGQSINYLVEAAYEDVDGGSTVLPYYNASEPSVPYSGPGGAGTPNYTVRQGVCALQVKPGIPAATGSQTTPAADTGYTPLYVVTVAYGQTTITGANISTVAGAPFITETLTQKISEATGDARYLQATSARSRLTGNATYYVATTGSDSTGNGTSGSPWATLQHAYAYLQDNIDMAGNIVTISVANGTYSTGMNVGGSIVGQTGPGALIIQGNNATPDSVVIACTSGYNFGAAHGAGYTLSGMKLTNSASGGTGIYAAASSHVYFSNLDFGAFNTNGAHINVTQGGIVTATGAYTISGGGSSHYAGTGIGGYIDVEGITITLTGTPAFSGAFASMVHMCELYIPGCTFTGSATGSRYTVNENSVISTAGGGASYLPGSTAGYTANGGQYT